MGGPKGHTQSGHPRGKRGDVLLLLGTGGASGLAGLSPERGGPPPGQGRAWSAAWVGAVLRTLCFCISQGFSDQCPLTVISGGRRQAGFECPFSFTAVSRQVRWVPASGGRRVCETSSLGVHPGVTQRGSAIGLCCLPWRVWPWVACCGPAEDRGAGSPCRPS